MNKEELKLYVKKSCENILKQLAENPKEMLNLLELQDKYNNLLKEKIELKRQIKKQKEVIDKIFSRITLWKMEDITMEISKVLDDLLDILKGDSNG